MNKTTILAIILWGFLFPVVTKAGTTESVVAVQDLSAPGSPLILSGTVTIRETTDGPTVRVSLTERGIVARNISSKTILTLVVWMDIIPSLGSPQRFVRQYECFFAPDVINPGDEHPIAEQNSAEQGEPYDANDPPRPGRAEARVMYVQFLDGSTFGTEAFGEDVLRVRSLAWEQLQRLDITYRQRGENAFLEELKKKAHPPEVNTLIENVRQTYKNHGAFAAVLQIRRMLDFANERRTRSAPSTSP